MARAAASPAADSADEDRGDAQAAEAVRVLWRSTRAILQQSRARYTTDLLKWRHRHRFDAIWERVEQIPGWFPEGSAVVMYALMRGRPPRSVVEIGSYLGRSTVFFALALRDLGVPGRVVSIDPHTGDRQQLEALSTDRLATYELFRQHCQAAGVEDLVEAHVASSLEVAAGWSEPVDLLYVDGWHSYDAVIADGEAWLCHLTPGGVVIFDDYAAYDEVRAAIHALAGRGLFRLWGSVFGQAIGGSAAEPPATLRGALLLSRGGLQHVLPRLPLPRRAGRAPPGA